MYRQYLIVMVMLALFITAAPQRSLTQDSPDNCPQFVKKALADVGNNCSTLTRNNACYGFNRLDVTFAQAVADNFFSKPSDRANLKDLETISTAGLDTALNQWGVAVMSVQANIPGSLPGQAVRFILFGDVKVENAVKPEDAFQSAEKPIEAVTLVGANIRSSPTTNANVVGSVPVGAKLAADALSADKKWLRVAFNNIAPGWISLDVVQASDAVNKLPVVTKVSKTPMQAFYFTTGVGDPKCNASPSLLVVQGPEKVAVDITANGADIRIGSTIVLKKTAQNQMQIIVVSGSAKIGNVVVPAGFTVFAPLSPDGQTLIGPLTDLRPMTQEELDGLETLEDIPANLLNYPIQIPTEAEIQQVLANFLAQNKSNSNGNNNTVVNGPAAGKADCSKFKLTSPLDAWAYKPIQFYWDPAVGATSYRITTSLGQTFDVNGTNTTINLAGAVGENLTWTVEALVDGEVACSMTSPSLVRDQAPRDTSGYTPKPQATAVETPGW